MQVQESNLQSGIETPPPINDLDVPIALKKGIRNCTQHPLSHFVSLDKLSPQYKSFFTQVDPIQIPQTHHEALMDKNWKNATNEEMKALNKNQTWEIVDLPKGKKTVGCKWVFTVKYKVEGVFRKI